MICAIKIRIYQHIDIKSYINDSFKLLEQLHKENPNFNMSNFLRELKDMVNSTHSYEKLENTCVSRIMEISFIHFGKEKLQKVTNLLLKFEEKEIETILS